MITPRRWVTMTSLRSNFTRLLTLSNRLLRRYRNNIARGKWRYQKRDHFHSLITHGGDLGFNKGLNHNLASTMFSRASVLNVRETRTTSSSGEVDEKEKEPDEFLEYTQQVILILVRLVIVGSVIIGLIVAYLITRLTHAYLFPVILRKGK